MSYEHYALITCEGKPAGDFTLGSSLVGMAWSPSSVVTGEVARAPTLQIQAPGTSFITGSGQSPTFASPSGSTALRLNGSTVYSMLEDAVTTAPCPGICFESWMKVERASDKTIAVAYTSEHSPHADGSPKEEQTFVLGVPQPSSSGIYDLVGNINGLQCFISDSASGSTPIHVKVTSKRLLQLSYWSPNEDGADPADMAVYLPFDDANAETSPGSPAQGDDDDAILADASVNCFHLTPLFGAATGRVASEAPVGPLPPHQALHLHVQLALRAHQ